MEFTTSWKEEGLAEGWAEGWAEGRAECAVSMVLRQLSLRFHGLQTSLTVAVQKLSVEQLETLSEDLLNFTSEADLEQWLVKHE